MMDKVKQVITDNIPLVVDLDGTLIKSDILYLGFKMLLQKNIFYFFSCVIWLAKGKAFLKQKIHEKVQIQPENLPYNIQLLDFLYKESAKGRKIILATASLRSVAVQISKIYPIFNEIYGTENRINLKGKNKLKLLVEKFGKRNFDYIGNSYSDLIIFDGARYSYLVNPKKTISSKARKISNLKYVWNI